MRTFALRLSSVPCTRKFSVISGSAPDVGGEFGMKSIPTRGVRRRLYCLPCLHAQIAGLSTNAVAASSLLIDLGK